MTVTPLTPGEAPASADVIVIGGGIIGCAAAAILADRGVDVIVVEGTAIAAGASGRNLGAIQHPFDPILAPLHEESLTRYRALAGVSDGAFAIGDRPAGLLLLNRDARAAAAQARRMADAFPELSPAYLDPDEVSAAEPALAHGPAAVQLRTGYPVPPGAATAAWADLAVRNGAGIVVGAHAQPTVRDARVTGVALDDGTAIASQVVLVAAGPWTPALVDPTGAWQPVRPTWGVTVQLRLEGLSPRHVLEEDEVDTVNRAAAATARAAGADPDAHPPSLFSMASAGGVTTLGSTFLSEEPDPGRIGPLLLRRATPFVPAVRDAEIVERRMCARPQSIDGRPFIGPVREVEGLHVCAGHGPWGISIGPATAAMAARAILDGTLPPPELDAQRPF